MLWLKVLESPSVLNLHILSQNLDSQLICTDLPLCQPCSNTHALSNKDAKPLL